VHRPGRRGDPLGKRPDLFRRGDVVGAAGDQEQRAVDPTQVHPLPGHRQGAGGQLVVLEQVLDDPQVERARHVLHPLEPVGELEVPRHVLRVADVAEQRQVALPLGGRLQQLEAEQLAGAALHAAAERHHGLVRGERAGAAPTAGPGEETGPVPDRGGAGVAVDRGTGDGQRAHLLGVQRREDHREPAALAVADQVHPAAQQLDRVRQQVQVLLDGAVGGLLGGTDPVQAVQPVQPGLAQRQQLALAGGEVHDAGVVPGLRGQHQGGQHAAVLGCAAGTVAGRVGADRVVTQAGQRPVPDHR
jgi:hypothetical protein